MTEREKENAFNVLSFGTLNGYKSTTNKTRHKPRGLPTQTRLLAAFNAKCIRCDPVCLK